MKTVIFSTCHHTAFQLLMPSLCLMLAAYSANLALAVDGDNDGIPADWESFRGTSDANSSDALVDFDGDGLNTRAEYLTLGRPWGNYTFYSLPALDLPGDLIPSTISRIETHAANRVGEFVFTIHGTASGTDYSRTFLWKPAAVSPVPRLIEVSPTQSGRIPFNDYGETVYWNSSNQAEVRNLHNWSAGYAIVDSGSPPSGAIQELAGIANDCSVLFVTKYTGGLGHITTGEWRNALGSCSPGLLFDREYSGGEGWAVDSLGSAWYLGSDLDSVTIGGIPFFFFDANDTFAEMIQSGGARVELTVPDGLAGVAFTAAADGFAVGNAFYDPGIPDMRGVYATPSGITTLSGGVAGSTPILYGVTDTGTVFGYASWPANQPFLWNQIAVPLAKARPGVSNFASLGILSASGALFALDANSTSIPPQPVAWLPAASFRGDGSADEPAISTTDTDQDGIVDARELASSLSSILADSDGDGLGDLWEAATGRDPATAESPSSLGATRLSIHSPARHPLSRAVVLP